MPVTNEGFWDSLPKNLTLLLVTVPGGVNLRYIFRLFCQNLSKVPPINRRGTRNSAKLPKPTAGVGFLCFETGGNPWKKIHTFKQFFDSPTLGLDPHEAWPLRYIDPKCGRPVNLISSKWRSHKVTGFWIETYGSMQKLQHTQAFSPNFPIFFGRRSLAGLRWL